MRCSRRFSFVSVCVLYTLLSVGLLAQSNSFSGIHGRKQAAESGAHAPKGETSGVKRTSGPAVANPSSGGACKDPG